MHLKYSILAWAMIWGMFAPVLAAEDTIKPVKQDIEGWTVWVDPALLEGPGKEEVGDLALKVLAHHLFKIKLTLAPDVVEKLQTLEIWIDLHNEKLGNMQYHPSRQWLIENGHDPALAKKVHIPRAANLYSKAQIHKHNWVVLHELAHAYHDQVLGYEDPDILQAFKEAQESGRYEKVRLFNGKDVTHYALSNHKEYFAEMTESYFGRNDFYPFVYIELKDYDPSAFALMEKIWGKRP
jgi:dipeptidyl-peptidase-4